MAAIGADCAARLAATTSREIATPLTGRWRTAAVDSVPTAWRHNTGIDTTRLAAWGAALQSARAWGVAARPRPRHG